MFRPSGSIVLPFWIKKASLALRMESENHSTLCRLLHQYGRRKPTETSVFKFSYLWVNSSLEKLIKIKAIFILRHGLFRSQNLQKSVMSLTHLGAFLAASQMPSHAKFWKFKRSVSQNKEPFWTQNLLVSRF